MTLRHLEVYLTVCKYMSMTKAAQELYMSQPAVSIYIKELEEFYHVILFDRMNRKLYLTNEGKLLLQQASLIIEKYQTIPSVLNNNQNQIHCIVGINQALAQTNIPQIFNEMEKQFPQVIFSYEIVNASELERKVKNNEIQFALTDSINDYSDLIIIPYDEGKMVPVIQKGKLDTKVLTYEKLVQYPLLLREKGSGNRQVIDQAFNQHGLIAPCKVESISDYTLYNFARNGMGIAFIPENMVDHTLDCLEIEGEQLIRHYYLIYSSSKYIPAILQQCMEYLKSYK